jgi:hypothetical protein
MRTVLASTDGKHIGQRIDETASVITFRDGTTMVVEKRLHDDTVLANSHYVLFLSKE